MADLGIVVVGLADRPVVSTAVSKVPVPGSLTVTSTRMEMPVRAVAEDLLWPYSRRFALLAVPASLGVLVVVLTTLERFTDIDQALLTLLVYAGVVLSLVPLALMVVDLIAKRRAVVDFRWLKLDFSRAEVQRHAATLPDNIGVAGALVADSGPVNIVRALDDATDNRIVKLDIGRGRSWWVTRLLVLAAGAVRAGAPEVLVFVGMKENEPQTFLGWAPPDKVLTGILDDRDTYRAHYMKARAIALQLEAFGPQGMRPPVLTPETQRYFMDDDYVQRGSAALDGVLMDQIAMASLEVDPDRLTRARLDDLVGYALCRDMIDVDAASDEQVSALLATRGRYVALVRGTTYVSLINRKEAERALLRQMVQPRTAPE